MNDDADVEIEQPDGARPRMSWGQKAVVVVLLITVTAPSVAAFYSYFSGVRLQLLAGKKAEPDEDEAAAPPSISLVSGKAHTLEVSEEVASALGIRKEKKDSVSVAQPPKAMRPLVLPGSTALDPTRLARIRARFAPARVVSLGQVWDIDPKTHHTEYRELRQGDPVSKGDLLGVFYSVDVGSKKNDLLDALITLDLDQRVLDRVQKNIQAVPEVLRLQDVRAVQADRNAITRALNTLRLWEVPQEEIDAIHVEAKKLSADKSAWSKTREGRWVNGENLAEAAHAHLGNGNGGKSVGNKPEEDPWGRVTLRAPFDGVIVERNVHVDEMVVDNTVNLFQIADVSRLLVMASCPEEQVPILEALARSEKKWTVQTVGTSSAAGLPGTIDEIGYIIDPTQHTAVIKGYVENPGRHIRAGQYVTATVNIQPPKDVVEIPVDGLVDDGKQSLVFVQPDAAKLQYTMRRVQVTHRFDNSVFIKDTPIPKEEQLTALEAEEGLLPVESLRPGERVLVAGSVELKRAMLDLESQAEGQLAAQLAKGKLRSPVDLETRALRKPKASKG
jgi:cobalt-zinc-cadmium efflux system membrane fusion protein